MIEIDFYASLSHRVASPALGAVGYTFDKLT